MNASPFQEWLSGLDFDRLPWPLNVLVEAPPETIIAQRGITLSGALETVFENVAKGTMGFCPPQGNNKVAAILTPINDDCVEISLYSIDRTFGLYQEVKRLLDWGFQELPYRHAVVGTHSKDLFPMFKRLGFTGPVELPHYHPSGGSWFYFFLDRDVWVKAPLAKAA